MNVKTKAEYQYEWILDTNTVRSSSELLFILSQWIGSKKH